MTEKVKPWLDNTQDGYDWPMLPPGEILAIWRVHRNSMVGHMASEEIMKRIARGELFLLEKEK